MCVPKNMRVPLSRNEMEILDRQLATVNHQMTEIAHLLEVRLGNTNELAGTAKLLCEQLTKLSNRVHRQNTLEGSGPLKDQSQSA
jgi:hypothetical protein